MSAVCTEVLGPRALKLLETYEDTLFIKGEDLMLGEFNAPQSTAKRTRVQR